LALTAIMEGDFLLFIWIIWIKKFGFFEHIGCCTFLVPHPYNPSPNFVSDCRMMLIIVVVGWCW